MFKHLLVFLLWLLLPAFGFGQIEFIENRGQWDPAIRYQAEFPGGLLRVENQAFIYTYVENFKGDHHEQTKIGTPYKIHNIRVSFLGSSSKAKAEGQNILHTYHNYYLGNDPSKWASRVPLYEKVLIPDVYPGIDLEVFGSGGSAIKYNFIVHPGADPSLVKLKYSGASSLKLKNGSLEITTIFGKVEEMPPVAYQFQGKSSPPVKIRYRLKEEILSFDLPEGYQHSSDLVIDPLVVFSSYTGSFSDNFGFTATYDFDGYAYTGGTVYGADYRTSAGVIQMVYGGGITGAGDKGRDAAIMKLSPDGTSLEYKTFIGGLHNEQPHSMVVDQQQNLIIFGSTFSQNFPNIGTGAFNQLNGESDIFVIKLNRDGTQIMGMTFIGGNKRDGLNGLRVPGDQSTSPLAYNYGDEYRGEVIVDKNNNVYFASCTESSFVGGFPVKNSFNTTFSGNLDACVFKLSPDLSQVLWGAYLGGTGHDASYGIALDSRNDVFVCGGSNSPGNAISANGFIKTNSGGIDGFVVKISNDGQTIRAGSYIGTPDYDQCYFVQTDKSDNVYLTGQTDGTIPFFPPDVYNEPQGGQFIYKLTNTLNQVQLSSVYGTGIKKPQLSPSAFMVDSCERIFISGWGGTVNSPLNGGHGGNTLKMVYTRDAYDTTTDGSDFYLAVFSKGMKNLMYATFLGGGTNADVIGEHVDGGTSRFDPRGIIYQGVCGGCGGRGATTIDGFPTTAGAYGRYNKSSNCNNAIFKLDYENMNRAPVVNDTFITLMAGESLNTSYFGHDPDNDSLFIDFTGEALDGATFPKPYVQLTGKRSGLGSLKNAITWKPGCPHISGDTFKIKVVAKDKGCPYDQGDTATIRILVTAPPVPIVPEVICLAFLNNDRIRLSWSGGDSSEFLEAYLILKKTGNGPWVQEKLITKNENKEWIDINATNNSQVNYCYAFVGRNVCGVYGDTSYIVCTADQLASPVKTEEIVVTTVKENQYTYTIWTRSGEEDFSRYILQKKYNDPKNTFEFVAEIKNVDDTTFLDKQVEVSKYSYCYQLLVKDKCGQSSRPSNIGCSILLTGKSVPYEHQLMWNPYLQWEFGVSGYTLWRKDDRMTPAALQTGNNQFIKHNDTALDYDWGGYWYKVIADENSGNLAISESNEIYLVQKPLLHVPTAITRNGDELNNVWGICDVFVKDYKLLVYNRWGQKVLETDDKNFQWDGYFRSEDPFDNVFIWIVSYTGWDNSKHQQKGTLTILR